MKDAMICFNLKDSGIKVSKDVGFPHITLWYFGPNADEDAAKRVAQRLRFVLKNRNKSLYCKINGKVIFVNKGSEDAYGVVVDGIDLPYLRVEIEVLTKLFSVPIYSEHGFVPHITLGYKEVPNNWSEYIGKEFYFKNFSLFIDDKEFVYDFA